MSTDLGSRTPPGHRRGTSFLGKEYVRRHSPGSLYAHVHQGEVIRYDDKAALVHGDEHLEGRMAPDGVRP